MIAHADLANPGLAGVVEAALVGGAGDAILGAARLRLHHGC